MAIADLPLPMSETMDVDAIVTCLAEEGYCLFENVIDPWEAERLDRLARPVLDAMGTHYVSLEGAINHIPELADICMHPLVMEVAEAALGEGFILANTAVKWCKPGTPKHGLHADWPLKGVSWSPPGAKMPPISGMQVFWMLSEATEENGATRIVPFSHHTRGNPRSSSYAAEIPVVGKPGSMFLYHNGLFHSVGANTTTDQHRLLVDNFYLPGCVYRPPDAWPLVSRVVYDGCPPRLQELLAASLEP